MKAEGSEVAVRGKVEVAGMQVAEGLGWSAVVREWGLTDSGEL